MEIKNIQRDKKKEKKISMSIKVSKRISDWMKQNNISPTKVFVTAIEQLMEDNKNPKK